MRCDETFSPRNNSTKRVEVGKFIQNLRKDVSNRVGNPLPTMSNHGKRRRQSAMPSKMSFYVGFTTTKKLPS